MESPTFSIIESTDAMKKIFEFVDWNSLHESQKWIVSEIVNFKTSRRKLIDKWEKIHKETISHAALNTAIIRTSLSRRWTKGMLGGNEYYLCDQDMEALEEEIKTRAQMCKALNTITILDEATKLKTMRYMKAKDFLFEIGSTELASKISQTVISSPCRTWINMVLDRIDSHLTKNAIYRWKEVCSFEKNTISSSSLTK